MQESDRPQIGHLYLAGCGEAVYGENLVVVCSAIDSIEELLELAKEGSDLLVGGLRRRGWILRVSGL